MIRLLVGLGNPGPEYEHTRHNAGFWFIDAAASQLKARLAPERAYFGLYARLTTPHGPVCLLEPSTYMNASGKSVAAVTRFFKIAPEEVLVVHDELDLMPGQVKMKLGGSHAGHNGLRDIQAHLGTPAFWRLRLGIGHPGVKAEVINYVLRKPLAAERDDIDSAIDKSLGALDLLLAGEMDRALLRVHAGVERPKPPRKPPPDAQTPVITQAPVLPQRPQAEEPTS